MKKVIYILSILSLTIVFGTGYSQTFTSKDIKAISQNADSLLNLYTTYSSFSKDAVTISEAYISGFKDLFAVPSTKIFNDLDPKDETPSSIKLDTYIQYIKQWYTTGLGIDIKVTDKSVPVMQNGKGSMEIKIEKNILGLYKEQTEYRKKIDLIIDIVFDQKLKTFKIEAIDNPESKAKRKDDQKQYELAISKGNNLFGSKNYVNAKIAYEQAVQLDPRETYPSKQIQLCIKYIEQAKLASRKPVYIDIHLLPSFTSAKLTGTSGSTKPGSSSKFGFGLGAGVEFAVTKSEKGMLCIGVALDYMPYKSSLTMSAYKDTVLTKDKDGTKVILQNSIQGLNETLSLTMFEIPVYVKYKLLFSENFNMYFKAGLKIGLMIGKKYNSTANGEFMGQYPDYNDIVLYGNELAAYGYGTFSNIANSQSTLSNLKGMDISGFGGIGVGVNLSKSIGLHFGVNYTYGFTAMSGKTDNYKVSPNNTNLNSLTGLGSVKTSAFTIEAGLDFKLN